MNPTWAKKHILDQLAHGVPIQTILNPPPPKITVVDPVTGDEVEADDPDWTPPDLPNWSQVVVWLKDEAFKKEWEHARKLGASYNADELIVLKNKLAKETDPRMASKYKVMMEMIKTAAVWGDTKYSERTVQEHINTAPQSPEVVNAKIAQIERELGIGLSKGEVVDVVATEVKPKRVWSEAQLKHHQKLAQLQRDKKAAREAARDAGTKTSKT